MLVERGDEAVSHSHPTIHTQVLMERGDEADKFYIVLHGQLQV